MKNLLYIGNNLNNESSNLTSIQHLGGLLEGEGFSVRYASHIDNKVLRLLHMCWSCLVLCRWYDAVLIDTYSTQNYWYAVFCSQICRLVGKPYITILHGGNLPSRLESHPKWSKLVFSNSTYNISPSLYLKNSFEAKGYHTEFIPNAIDISQYPIITKSYNNIRLLWVRSFSEIYNPAMAVHVLKELKASGLNVELCMVGPDADGTLEAIKSLTKDLNLTVKFTGKLPKSEWIDISKDYNIFINTSNYDNMPISVIEAMALGFPIVSTNVGGISGLIKDTKQGLLVDKNDITAMTNAITNLSNNILLREGLSYNARQKAEQYDWNQIRKHWKKILHTN